MDCDPVKGQLDRFILIGSPFLNNVFAIFEDNRLAPGANTVSEFISKI